jgi:drug/metabolite transporter (DMT)-like permease
VTAPTLLRKAGDRTGAVLVVVACVGYSLFPIFARWADEGGASAFDVLVWRFAFAVPVLWVLSVLTNRRRAGLAAPGPPARRIAPGPLIVCGVLFALVALSAILAVERMPASVYTVAFYAHPAIVVVITRLAGHPLPPRALGALALTSAGIALTVPDVITGAGDAQASGLAFLAINAALYVAYIFATGRLLRSDGEGRRPDLVRVSAVSLTGALGVSLALLVSGAGGPMPSAQAWGAVAGMALASTVVATTAFAAGLARLGPARTTLLATIEPVLSLSWAVVLLGESLAPVQVVGAALVMGGVVWLQRPARPAMEV